MEKLKTHKEEMTDISLKAIETDRRRRISGKHR